MGNRTILIKSSSTAQLWEQRKKEAEIKRTEDLTYKERKQHAIGSKWNIVRLKRVELETKYE